MGRAGWLLSVTITMKQFPIISPTICPLRSFQTWGWLNSFKLGKVTAQLASANGNGVKNLITAVDKHKQRYMIGNIPN